MKAIKPMTKRSYFATLAILFMAALTACGPKEDASKFVALKGADAVNKAATKANPNGDPVLNANSFTVTPRATPAKIGEAFKDCPECPELVTIPAGNYLMGGTHAINIDRNLAVGKFEITQRQWRAIMNLPSMVNPARFASCGMNCPVEQVGWHYANVYITELNKKTGLKFRMLTEAEWEYAARAGTTTKYSFGDDATRLGEYAWFFDNTESTKPVGAKLPNAWGLYDMQGNVEEWVLDCMTKLKNLPADGYAFGGAACAYHATRGGSWSHNPDMLALTERGGYGAEYQDSVVGFRVVRELQ
jgi:formylglycine-generating enzyme required for sulfatase activity